MNQLKSVLTQARQERDELVEKLNHLSDEVASAEVLVLKLKGQWPTSDGSPIGIAYAKIKQLTQERDTLKVALQAIHSKTLLWVRGEHKERIQEIQEIAWKSLGGTDG